MSLFFVNLIAVLVPPLLLQILAIPPQPISIEDNADIEEANNAESSNSIDGLVLIRSSPGLKNVQANGQDDNHLMIDQDESMDFLWVWAMDPIIHQKCNWHNSQNIEHILLSVEEGANKDEGWLVNEIYRRIVLLNQHREDQCARVYPIYDNRSQEGPQYGHSNPSTQQVHLFRKKSIVRRHISELNHECKDNEKHAHEPNQKQNPLEHKVEGLCGGDPFLLIIDILVFIHNFLGFFLMVDLFGLEDDAYHHNHQ